MRTRAVVAGVVGALLMAALDVPESAASAVASAAVDPANVGAVWQEHHVRFVYAGRTARYSCEGLREKVRALLLDLGARRDLTVTAPGCEADARAASGSHQARLDVAFTAPALRQPATPPSTLLAPGARFVAFTITRDAVRNLGVGDCELVQEFARQILPGLATRALHADIRCDLNQADGNRFRISGEVLRTPPVMAP